MTDRGIKRNANNSRNKKLSKSPFMNVFLPSKMLYDVIELVNSEPAELSVECSSCPNAML